MRQFGLLLYLDERQSVAYSWGSRNVPLNLLSVQHGIASVDREIVLRERETTYVVDTTKPFKLNTGTKGVCV